MLTVHQRDRAFRLSIAVAALSTAACQADQRVAATHSCTDYARTPVLFVHGSGLTSSTWNDMIGSFEKNGYPGDYLFAIDMRPRDGDNVRAAERFVASGADRLLTRSRSAVSASGCELEPPEKIDIVAHSMGSFSSRWFVRFLGSEQVRTLITMAGANHGTDRLCGRSGAGDRQMCPAFADAGDQHSVQYRLNGSRSAPQDETPYGVGIDSSDRDRIAPDERRRVVYFTIRIEPDEWIVPAESAMLDGAGGVAIGNVAGFPLSETSAGNFLYEPQTSHDGLPYQPELIRFVLHLLQRPETP